MNTGMKMLMLDSARKGDYKRSGGRMGYAEDNYARMGYEEPEGTYGARDDMDVESRRRRDNRGRFRSEMDGYDMDMRRSSSSETESRDYGRMGGYPNRPFPVYEGGNRMNQIGFATGNEFPSSNYRMDATYGSSGSEELQRGYSAGSPGKLTREMADEWMSGIQNEDGTKGPHWTMEQAKQVMAQKGISMDPVEFWAVLCSLYADYCAVFKKHNVNKMDLYVDLACAWINDKDAQHGKTLRYFEEIVKH